MTKGIKVIKMTGIIPACLLCALLIGPVGCKAPDDIFTIGISHNIPIDAPILEGFREGMAESGYVEGRNIRYIYGNIPQMDKQTIEAKVKELLAQDIDLLFILEPEVAVPAKEIVEGTELPIIFNSMLKPMDISLVESLKKPGGNLTGVRFANTNLKALEWLAKAVHGMKKAYVPYNPDDIGAKGEIAGLDNTASHLGIELFLHEIHSVEEARETIRNLPEDIDAVFRIPSPTLNERNMELSRAALERGVPMGASLLLDEDVMITLTCDFYDMGKKAARMAHMINQGVKPSDIPVETSEVLLTVNLRIAERLGINIPDDVLVQATRIIR